jgi:ribosome-associated protein
MVPSTIQGREGISVTETQPQTDSSAANASLELALAAARAGAEMRGRDVKVIDLREQTALFDYFVIITGNSGRQLHAISEEIDRVLEKEMGDRRIGIEGYKESRWIVLDYGNVVMHIFDEETREFYQLENLWAEGVEVPLEGIVAPRGVD